MKKESVLLEEMEKSWLKIVRINETKKGIVENNIYS